MSLLFQNDAGQELLHAYVLTGNTTLVRSLLVEELEDFGYQEMQRLGNVRHFDHETMGIEEARLLKRAQLTKPAGGEDATQFIVVTTGRITLQAQNALLKVLEEPTPQTHIFLILPSLDGIIDTVISRVAIVQHVGENQSYEIAKKILAATPKKRLEYISEILENKDQHTLVDLLDGFEQSLRSMLPKDPRSLVSSLRALVTVREFFAAKSVPDKMLFEHLALMLPNV